MIGKIIPTAAHEIDPLRFRKIPIFGMLIAIIVIKQMIVIREIIRLMTSFFVIAKNLSA